MGELKRRFKKWSVFFLLFVKYKYWFAFDKCFWKSLSNFGSSDWIVYKKI